MEKNVTPVRTRMEKSMHLDVYRAPWIDVKFLDGHEERLSLRDCLEKATLIQSLEIKDARFELDNVAPYTLLTLILGRIYKPDSNDKQDMLSRGSFDLAKIDTYISSCEENGVSFDVFDESRPFLQDPVTRNGSKVESVGMLDPMMVSGNNAVFYGSSRFDGLGDWKTAEDILCMTPSQFIASVTRNHMYSNASGQAGATGYATAQAPLHCIIYGRNLFETLIISIPSITDKKLSGVPLWERPYDMSVPEIMEKYGTLDYLSLALLPGRSVRFHDIENGMVKSITWKGNLYKGTAKKEPKEFKESFFKKGGTGFNIIIKETEKKGKVERKGLTLGDTKGDLKGDFSPVILQLMQNLSKTGDPDFIREAVGNDLLKGPFHMVVYGGKLSTQKDEPQNARFDIALPENFTKPDVGERIKKIAAFTEYAVSNLRYELLKLEQDMQHDTGKQLKISSTAKTIVRHFSECAKDQLTCENIENSWIERISKTPTDETLEEIYEEIKARTMEAYSSYKTRNIFLLARHDAFLRNRLKDFLLPEEENNKKNKEEKQA